MKKSQDSLLLPTKHGVDCILEEKTKEEKCLMTKIKCTRHLFTGNRVCGSKSLTKIHFCSFFMPHLFVDVVVFFALYPERFVCVVKQMISVSIKNIYANQTCDKSSETSHHISTRKSQRKIGWQTRRRRLKTIVRNETRCKNKCAHFDLNWL